MIDFDFDFARAMSYLYVWVECVYLRFQFSIYEGTELLKNVKIAFQSQQAINLYQQIASISLGWGEGGGGEEAGCDLGYLARRTSVE